MHVVTQNTRFLAAPSLSTSRLVTRPPTTS